jgi:glycosyltransferase involved in cell wall biosynthesis
VIDVGGPHCGLRSDSALGGEVYERALLPALSEHGVRIKIGLPMGRALDSELPGVEATLLRPGRGLHWSIAPLAFVPYILRLLRQDEVDLLRGHSVLYTGPSLFAARMLARKRVPILLHHLHTDPTYAFLEASLLRRADAVVTISESSRRQLQDFGVDPGRSYVAHPGVNDPPAAIEPWPGAWPKTHGLKLLFVGRLIGRKRPELAINALELLLEGGRPASLVVAGDGPKLDGLRRLIGTKALGDYVTLVGHVSDSKKWRLLSTADVFLFPSALEGFGFAAAEAQRIGLPVIAAEGTASEEIVTHGESGFVVPGRPDSFAQAVERFFDADLRRRMGERARELSSRFNWNSSAARVAEVYAEVLARFRADASART